jgi:cell division transport system permease protein
MLASTVLTVVFATRGAMSGNSHIIDVLHFVGAEARFIALEFRHHFLKVGMKGAAAGGMAAVTLFLAIGWWTSRNIATPEADQAAALFGRFAIGLSGYMWIGVVVVLVAALTAVTTHITVINRLGELDAGQGGG